MPLGVAVYGNSLSGFPPTKVDPEEYVWMPEYKTGQLPLTPHVDFLIISLIIISLNVQRLMTQTKNLLLILCATMHFKNAFEAQKERLICIYLRRMPELRWNSWRDFI